MSEATTPIKMTTPGEWIVTTSAKYVPGGEPVYIVVARAETDQIVAIMGAENDALANEHIANAALLAVAKDMLDALVIIQNKVLDPGEESDLVEINAMISDIFAKLANEAGEEL